MADNRGQSPEQVALQRLLSADADAQGYLHDARVQTAQTLADGKEAARRLSEQTRAAAEAEAETRRQAAHAQFRADTEQVHEQAHQDVAAMRLRADKQLPAAVALVLAWVKAEG